MLSYRIVNYQDNKLNLLSSTVEDVPIVNNRSSDVPLVRSVREVQTFTPPLHDIQHCSPLIEGQYLWNIGGGDQYITIGSNAELWVADGMPNHDYGPNIFGLEPGKEGGQYIIYTYGMITRENERPYALTVMQDDNGQWRLKYSNEDDHEYNWCFTCSNGAFAIQWCGTPDMDDTHFVLYLDDDQLQLTNHVPDKLLPEHYLHNFYSL